MTQKHRVARISGCIDQTLMALYFARSGCKTPPWPRQIKFHLERARRIIDRALKHQEKLSR